MRRLPHLSLHSSQIGSDALRRWKGRERAGDHDGTTEGPHARTLRLELHLHCCFAEPSTPCAPCGRGGTHRVPQRAILSRTCVRGNLQTEETGWAALTEHGGALMGGKKKAGPPARKSGKAQPSRRENVSQPCVPVWPLRVNRVKDSHSTLSRFGRWGALIVRGDQTVLTRVWVSNTGSKTSLSTMKNASMTPTRTLS